MTRSPLHRLCDIAENIDNAVHWIDGKSARDIGLDDKLSAAIQMAIVIIAEAANHLPDAMLTTHPAIPWSDIIGMGNRLKHNYHHTSSQVIWDTVTNDLPQLRLVVTAMIAVLEKDEVPA